MNMKPFELFTTLLISDVFCSNNLEVMDKISDSPHIWNKKKLISFLYIMSNISLLSTVLKELRGLYYSVKLFKFSTILPAVDILDIIKQ